jgi:hypothetical protein
MDLFDKRFESYSNLRAVIADVIAHGTVPSSVYRLLVEHGYAEDLMKSDGKERQKGIERKHAAFREICKFYEQSLPLIQPYMRMHQKGIRRLHHSENGGRRSIAATA